jgi:hypothetical protein
MEEEIKAIQSVSEKSQIELPAAETTSLQSNSEKTQIEPSGSETTSIPAGLIKLKKAYPDFIESIGDNYLIWKDGTKMVYDNKQTYDIKHIDGYEELLNNADLEDQMSMDYPKGRNYKIPVFNFDPGRVRNEEFFRKMYGDKPEDIQKNIVEVKWLPKTANKTINVTSVNGIDKKIAAISDELEKLPELAKYIDNPGDSFSIRLVGYSNRLSMHSFGIVLDINNNYLDFWIYNRPVHGSTMDIQYRNNIPMEIVEIFEKYGFIWGGKWYHFETIHFEYRPELLTD